MKIGEKLLKHLSKKYAPLDRIAFSFERYDGVMKTDEDGNPILLFLGQATATGDIRGHRFTRVLRKSAEGGILKDHWDYKGKV
ncbi:hypothetical protein GCM10027275_18150 [Rhabdobacter roseus]|uniref:Uncharacterized protein n=1 Tax=Rhabdobacter roseus TaxID=1655419 RepID=A0A840TPT7_9BACT|nr:hypothetical protein [Rhabdobacter roseus]MBB5283737.1 hypothetical protein [Rhabdobacter roseus]